MVKHNRVLRHLPIDVKIKLREFKIQRKLCKRCKRGGYKQGRQRMIFAFKESRGVNKDSLIDVDIKKDSHVSSRSRNLPIGLANMRSRKNKNNLLKQIMVEEQPDMRVLTEVWLSSKHSFWIESTDNSHSSTIPEKRVFSCFILITDPFQI